MPALNVARLSNLLRGLFVLRGQDTVAPEINDELQGVVILEGERPEHRFLAGDFLCSAHVRVPAVAGTRGEVRVINPAGSGRICVIEKAQITQVIATPAHFYAFMLPDGSADLANVSYLARRDSRSPLGQFSTSHTSYDAVTSTLNPLGGRSLEFITSNNGIVVDFRTVPWILGPGGGIEIQFDGVNILFNASFSAYERSLERSEL